MKKEYPIARVSKELGISRQALYKNSTGKVRQFYHRKDDEKYLSMIREEVLKRSTYGYKRITTMVNRKLDQPINRKRVARLMKIYGLMLPKNGILRPNHEGTGKVMVLHSNTRWCSDGFEIRCFNREKVYVAFVLDCKDRQAISFVSNKEPLCKGNIQSLMIQSVEARFSRLHTPRTIQFLSDRGSVYMSIETKQTARHLGLEPCFTRAYSPESNGMAEAFVKTFKRDYVYTNDCESADHVIAKLKEWFDDYNQAPHSALDYKSPLEYLQANNQ